MKKEKLTTETFIKRAISIHGQKYDYSRVQYVNYNAKVEIVCTVHGILFMQRPRAHLAGQGCYRCANNSPTQKTKLTTAQFIERAKKTHGDKYDYSKTIYTSAQNEVEILCKKHDRLFRQRATSHIYGNGCPQCGIETKTASNITTEMFISRSKAIHGDKYDYSKAVYTTSNNTVTIKCNKCSQKDKEDYFFEQLANSHLRGHGCWRCRQARNDMEIAWLNSMKIPDDRWHRQVRLPLNNGKYIVVDGFDPSTNTIYEFYGNYYHGNPLKYNQSDLNVICKKTFGDLFKRTMKRESDIKESGYTIISTWENDIFPDT